MPSRSTEAIVVSPLRLTRELLCMLLAQRCGLRIAGQYSRLEDCIVPPTVRILVWDQPGQSAGEQGKVASRLRGLAPQLRIVSIDASIASAEGIVTLVRGFLELPDAVRERLTRLECEVLLAVASGLRNADIARRMRRSSKTVEKHRANAQRKLGLRNVAQLTAFAIQNGLLRTDAILAATPAGKPRMGNR
jgi:DNA-binding CsgD family transcriptional regulator